MTEMQPGGIPPHIADANKQQDHRQRNSIVSQSDTTTRDTPSRQARTQRVMVIGLNPISAPKELWDSVAIPAENVPAALVYLKGMSGVREAVIVSTPQRLECYVALDDGHDGFELMSAFLAASGQEQGGGNFWESHRKTRSSNPGYSRLQASNFPPFLYLAEGLDAARHLFNATCGIDSFAFGTPAAAAVQKAYHLAQEEQTTGMLTDNLFQKAIQLSEKAGVGETPHRETAALAAATLDLAEHVFDDLDKRELLVVGSGKACEAAAVRLLEAGITSMSTISNARGHAEAVARTLEGTPRRAQATSSRSHSAAGRIASSHPASHLQECLACADIVLFSSPAEELRISAKAIRSARKTRRGRMMLLVDFMPGGSIDPTCANVDDIFLYSLDDLEQFIDETAGDTILSQEELDNMIFEELAHMGDS